MIPLRPELFEFAEPQSVCRLSCTCKTLRGDVRDAKPWGLLARAQLQPPKPRDEADALARVRSHVRRRLLAKALPTTLRALEGLTMQQAIAREAPAEVAFTPDAFSDFTYFVRLTDGERLIFEGDFGVNRESDEEGLVLHLSPRHANLKWMGRADRLHQEHVKIALVAVRDHDQAMVSLSHLNICYASHGGERTYGFSVFGVIRGLAASARSNLQLDALLSVTQDGYVNGLELRPEHVVNPPGDYEPDIGPCDESLFQYLLTYLAGIHNPTARAFVLARIESWLVVAERWAGWDDLEALAEDLAYMEEKIGEGYWGYVSQAKALRVELGMDVTSDEE